MHSYLKSALVAASLLAASAYGAAAFEAETVEPAELREGPAWGFAAIVVLPPGAIVEVLNCDRRWCEVAIEDFEGFVPRGSLALGGYSPPLYIFPPLFSQPSLWHGRYYSRDHYRYESRSRWRDRDNRRLYVLPQRVQPRPLPPPLVRPLRPIDPNERRGQKQFQPGQKQFQPDGPQRQRVIEPDRTPRGPSNEQPRIQRGPDQPRIQRAPDQPRIQRAPDQPRPQIQQQAPAPQRTAPPAEKQKQKNTPQ